MYIYDDMAQAEKFQRLGAFAEREILIEISETDGEVAVGYIYDFENKTWSEPAENNIERPEAFSALEPLAAFEAFSQNIAEPSNAHIAHMISELRAELVSAGVIKDNTIK